jgi:hypothetical protein
MPIGNRLNWHSDRTSAIIANPKTATVAQLAEQRFSNLYAAHPTGLKNAGPKREISRPFSQVRFGSSTQ